MWKREKALGKETDMVDFMNQLWTVDKVKKMTTEEI